MAHPIGSGRRFVAAGCLTLTLCACARVRETRTRWVVDDESHRVTEQRRPELWLASAKTRLTGNDLEVRVQAEQHCIVEFSERRVIRERIRRVPDERTLGLEVVGLGVGLGAAAYGYDRSNRSTGSASVSATDFVGVMGIFGAVASGVALAVDARKHTDVEVEKVVATPEQERRVAPCSLRGAPPRSIELTTEAGRRFVSSIDGLGIAHFFIPDDFWEAAPRVRVNVRIDGREASPIVLERSP